MQKWLLTVSIEGSIVVFEATIISIEVEHFPLERRPPPSLRAAELYTRVPNIPSVFSVSR